MGRGSGWCHHMAEGQSSNRIQLSNGKTYPAFGSWADTMAERGCIRTRIDRPVGSCDSSVSIGTAAALSNQERRSVRKTASELARRLAAMVMEVTPAVVRSTSRGQCILD